MINVAMDPARHRIPQRRLYVRLPHAAIKTSCATRTDCELVETSELKWSFTISFNRDTQYFISIAVASAFLITSRGSRDL